MAESKAAAPEAPLLSTAVGDETVIVEVGPDRRRYNLHKSLLVHYSEYFARALNGSWKESDDGKIYLEDVEPGTFNIFVTWLYTQKLSGAYKDWNKLAERAGATSDGTTHVSFAQVKLYVLADRLAVSRLRTAANLAFVEAIIDTAPWYDVVLYAFDNLPSTNPLLRLLIDTHCKYWRNDDNGNEEELAKQLPNVFLLGVMTRYKELLHDGAKGELNPCDYHEHGSDEEKKTCKESTKDVELREYT